MLDDLKRLSGPAKLATISAVSCVIGIGFCGAGFSFQVHILSDLLVRGGVFCFWGGLLGILIAFVWGVVAAMYESWSRRR